MPKFCPNCGESISDKVKFCPSCGANIDSFISTTDDKPIVEENKKDIKSDETKPDNKKW